MSGSLPVYQILTGLTRFGLGEKLENIPLLVRFSGKTYPPEGGGRSRPPSPPQASSATATYTLEISYQTAKSTLPVWGRWKIFWNSVTASWVAGP